MTKLQPVAPIVIENLLLGACPERKLEIQQDWKTFQPEFYVKPDDVGAALSARKNRITWMHKTFVLDWVIATLGMQAIAAYSPYIFLALTFNLPVTAKELAQDNELASIQSQMDEVCYFAKLLWKAEQLEDLDWPSNIPIPGTFPEASLDPKGKATFDLACLAAAATFFHELRHVQFQAEKDAPEISIEEECACDEHARVMLLDRIADYCTKTEEPYSQVLDKRIMGLATAALCIAQQEPVGMQAAIVDSHPPVKERFRILVLEASADENALAWVYTGCVLIHLLRNVHKLPDALTFSSAKDLCKQLVAAL